MFTNIQFSIHVFQSPMIKRGGLISLNNTRINESWNQFMTIVYSLLEMKWHLMNINLSLLRQTLSFNAKFSRESHIEVQIFSDHK